MNRRAAIKSLAGIATLLTSGVTIAAPPVEPDPEFVLVTFTVPLRSFNGEEKPLIDQVNTLVDTMRPPRHDGSTGRRRSVRPSPNPSRSYSTPTSRSSATAATKSGR
jgi:hypothetical protein